MNTAMVQRVLVIGLDSAPLYLLEKWVAEGHLPNIGKLMEEGATGILNSTFPPLSPAAWSSFATGMYPGKHGVYDHAYRAKDAYRMVPTNARRRGATPLWQLINENGGSAGVINIPETYPPVPVDGFMITGMSTPSDDADWCFPASLKNELKEAMGGYKVFGPRSKENLDRSIEGMHKTIPMRMEAAAYLWRAYEPDFMTLVFMETDVIQHKTWQYMDESHPRYDEAGAARYGSAIRDVYRKIDEHLPLLLDQVGEETAVVVMSDHGAGPIDKWLNLNAWLLDEGFLTLKNNAATRFRAGAYKVGWTPNNVYRLASRLGLGIVDQAANRVKKQSSKNGGSNDMNRLFLSFDDVDWSRTRAYTLGGNMTGIWINLQGREPLGCVKPGEEYEKTRDELIHLLKTMKDPQTGKNVVTAVHRRENVYDGPYVERAPDLVFETLDEQYVGFGAQEFVTNRIMEPSPIFSGCHRRAGMVILKGKPFKMGEKIGEHQIVDLTPTVLHLLGHPVPEDMDGKVMCDAMLGEQIERFPVKYNGASWKPSIDEDAGYETKDENAVADRLRDLGYL